MAYRDMRHHSSSIDGSAALKLDRSVRRLEQAGDPRRVEERIRVLPRSRPRPQAARIPVFALLCAAMLAASAILGLMDRIELTRLSAETVSLKSTLEELETERAALTYRYEKMFDERAVRQAAQDADLVEPGQVIWLDVGQEDSTVVLKRPDEGLPALLAGQVRAAFRAVKDYLD